MNKPILYLPRRKEYGPSFLEKGMKATYHKRLFVYNEWLADQKAIARAGAPIIHIHHCKGCTCKDALERRL